MTTRYLVDFQHGAILGAATQNGPTHVAPGTWNFISFTQITNSRKFWPTAAHAIPRALRKMQGPHNVVLLEAGLTKQQALDRTKEQA